VVQGLPRDGRVRLGALDAFNGTNYNMDPNGSGNFSKVGDTESINTLADTSGVVPTNDYSMDITIEDYQGFFVPGGRKTTGISFDQNASAAASGLYFNSGTDTAVTTNGLSKGDSYSVQVSDPVKLEHGQLTQYDFAKVSLPDPRRCRRWWDRRRTTFRRMPPPPSTGSARSRRTSRRTGCLQQRPGQRGAAAQRLRPRVRTHQEPAHGQADAG
jgi:hypothetical protein